MHGWIGKILHVNLNNLETTHFSTQPYAEKYLGGRGVASRIYWETVAPETKAFDPENRLIFMTGPLVATSAQAATRLFVVGKSPMTFPEGFCYGGIGGFVGAELKRAGFDGIVVEGHASKPVYLWIHDGQAELRDASLLWGQGVYRVGELLRQTHGKKVRFITTGVAGERRVRTAVAVGSHDSTLSAGFGAVMGSKNLKALAIIGTGRPSIADPASLKELNRHTIHISKRLRLVPTQMIRESGHSHLFEVVGLGGCYNCRLECLRGLYRLSNGREGYRRCQALEAYLPWKYSRDDEPADTVFDTPTLCNDYSIGTFELQSIVNWLYSCYQSGILTEQDTCLPLSKIGTREFLERLLRSIAYREDFGDILAEGLVRAGEKVSDQARSMFSYTIAPIGQHDIYPPRAFVVHALIYPMEPRLYQPIAHELLFTWVVWKIHLKQPNRSPVSSKVFLDIAKAFWGSEEAGHLSSYEGKALAAKKMQNRTYIKDSLGLCDFAWPITYSLNTPNNVGDPDLEDKIFSAVTGISVGELDQYAERISNLQRAILVQEGRRVPQDDFPPEFNFIEPLGTDAFGREMMVPGHGGKIVSATGNTLDREKYMNMLKDHYSLRGWDQETGLPKVETLARLGLQELGPIFQR